MAVKYAVAKAVSGKDRKDTYYARAQYDGVTSIDDIAQLIEQISAISVGDVLSVLNTLDKIVATELANGRIVDLGDLGRIRLSIRAKGVPTPEEVKRETILATRAVFVPGPALRLQQQGLRFAFTTAEPQPRKPEDKPHDEPSTPPTPGGNEGGGTGNGAGGNEQIGV